MHTTRELHLQYTQVSCTLTESVSKEMHQRYFFFGGGESWGLFLVFLAPCISTTLTIQDHLQYTQVSCTLTESVSKEMHQRYLFFFWGGESLGLFLVILAPCISTTLTIQDHEDQPTSWSSGFMLVKC